MSFSLLLKNIILISIILICAPFFIENIKKNYVYYLEPKTQIGILTINEPLINSCDYSHHLANFFKNPAIKGILIRIDGGESAPGTAQALFNEIELLKKENPKPVISIVENRCIAGFY